MDILKYLKDNLNEQQFQAASYVDSSSLILAGAGSGKTRVLTFKIAYLIFGQKVSPENILAVTFTNKAANEMKERILDISKKLQEQQNSDVELDFDAMIGGSVNNNIPQKINLNWVGTFHSVFLKILKFDIEKLEMKYTKNFGVYDEGESLSLLKDVIKNLKIADKISEREIKNKISSLKNKGISYQRFLNILDRGEELVGQIYEKYQKGLENANALDFDDLLFLSNMLFNKVPEVLFKRKNKFKYILVDEAQDTNQLQFDLIKQLSGKDGNVSFIGDDYQSIYMRRGAVMDNFLNISKYWDDVKIFKLEINYRSKPHIVDAGNHIIKLNTKQYEKDVKSHRQGEDNIRVFCFGDETDEAFSIIELIQKMREDKGYKRGNFAILYRTNAQSQPFESVLVAKGIPYKIFGGFKFFERKEIRDILAYLKYIVNPRDNVALKRIINTPSRKIGTTSIQAIEEVCSANNLYINDAIQSIDTLPVSIGPGTKNAIKEFNTIIKYIKSSLETLDLAKIIQNLVSNIRYEDYLIKLEGSKEQAKEKMENIGQLMNMASKYEAKGIEGLRLFLEEISLIVDLETDEKNTDEVVKLMSVHASKGLEFPVIFIVGVEENLFPTSSSRMEQDVMEEERRLMYVAITRAKDILFLSHTNCRQKRGQMHYNQPSRFINELPPHLIKSFDLSAAKTSFKPKTSDITDGQVVRHPLFGEGVVKEIFMDKAMVQFNNTLYGTRKVPLGILRRI